MLERCQNTIIGDASHKGVSGINDRVKYLLRFKD